MAVFQYIATDVDASVARGTVVADTPRQARDQLRERGLSVHELQAAHQSAAGSRLRAIWRSRLLARRGRQAKVTTFVRELSTLLGVGMPLLEALDSLARQHKGWFGTTVLTMRDQVAAGQSLAESMKQHPWIFDAVTVSMTQVGEDAGTLDVVLQEVAEFQEKAAQLRNRIGSALLYPAIVLCVGIGVSIFLMSYVVPGLLASLMEAGRELPWITLAVKTASDAIRQGWWAMGLGAIAIAAAFMMALSTTLGRRLWDRLLLKLPVLGELLVKQATVRIAFVVSTLMKSGIAFEQAIAIAQQSTANVVLRDALRRCELAVRAGRDIGLALEQTAAFTPTVVQVFALGQQSGRLEEMLQRLSVDYDRQVASAATRFTAVLEPLLILLLALVVGAIAFAVILPILEIGNVL